MNDMVDMSRFIEAKSDQLNADDLIGNPRTITVTRVTGNDGDQPVSIFYQGDNGKPFKPCKTMRRILMAVWGQYANDYVGRSMTLYRDDRVTFGGLEVGGIRISHMSHIDKEQLVVVMKTKGKKAGIKIQPLKVDRQQNGGQQADRVADGVRDLLARIAAGEDVAAEPAVQKQRAWLAEKRPDLAKQIDKALAARSDDDPFGEGLATEQRGDHHTDEDARVAGMIAEIEALDHNREAINRYVLNADFAGLSADQEQAIRDHAYAAIGAA